MNEPERERAAEPYSRPATRKAEKKASPARLIAGAAAVAGVLLFAGLRMHVGAPAATPIPPIEAAQPAPAPAPAPPPASQPAADAPSAPSPLKQCRTYADYVADQKSPAVSDAQLVEEAACLCSLAGAYLVQGGSAMQPYRLFTSCPSGSTPAPFAPEVKVWLGRWIDEPGHHACGCTPTPREMKVLPLTRDSWERHR